MLRGLLEFGDLDMVGQVAGATTIANAFPACLGLPGNWHGLAHGAGKKGGAEKLGRFDQFLAQNHARFLQSLAEAQEGEGSVLDRTLVLYGSSNSRTHNNLATEVTAHSIQRYGRVRAHRSTGRMKPGPSLVPGLTLPAPVVLL